MFTMPNKINWTIPAIGPTSARAIGKASMLAPMVSVKVSENAAQNGGKSSNQAAILVQVHRRRVSNPRVGR